MSAWVWGEMSYSQEGRCLILDKDPSPVPLSLETGKNIPLLLGPPARPAGLIASATGQGGVQ